MVDSSKVKMNQSYLTDVEWSTNDRFVIEADMVRRGGKIGKHGNGVVYHFKKAITALWPHFAWHNWSDLLIESFATHSEVGVMGPASSGKTYVSAAYALATAFIWPKNTSIIMSSTTRSGLQLRVWGSIKELFAKAKERRDWLPGKILESQFLLSMDSGEDVRDFRDGIIGVACKVGGTWVGLSNYVGIKNERVLLIADEASLMGRGFLDSVSNLRKNPFFQLIALGNPKDRNDALGVVCEPASEVGGWDGIGYAEKTRTWPTRARSGIGIQLCGYDSPNFKYPAGLNPYKYLITPEQINHDLAYYGKDSLQFSMMNLGCMPRDGGSRRVITMQLCEQCSAFSDVVWNQSSKLIRVVGVDAAYSGVGGDRCVLTDLTFGKDVNGNTVLAFTEPQVIIPVNPKSNVSPEDQIALFIKAYCEGRSIKPSNFGLDSTGRGTLVSALARLWSPEIIPVEFGGKPTDRLVRLGEQKTERDSYGKMVTALWWASRLVIESKQMRSLSRECAEEGASREWTINKDGKVDVEPKDKTKERMGRSPDLYDSFVVAVEIARRCGFFIASVESSHTVMSTTPEWLKRLANKTTAMKRRHELTYA